MLGYREVEHWLDFNDAVNKMGAKKHHRDWLAERISVTVNNIHCEQQLAIANSITLLYTGLANLYATDYKIAEFMNEPFVGFGNKSPWGILCVNEEHIAKRVDIILQLAMKYREIAAIPKKSRLKW